jgi:hypothetical protein
MGQEAVNSNSDGLFRHGVPNEIFAYFADLGFISRDVGRRV